ncbi:MAG: CAP domain-containing protein [Bacillota bacterium]
MKRKIIAYISVGVISLGIAAIPGTASSIQYNVKDKHYWYVSPQNTSYWTYEYVNGKLTRKLVQIDNAASPTNTAEGKETPVSTPPVSQEENTSTETSKETSSVKVPETVSNEDALSADELKLLQLINDARKKSGLPAVQIDMEVAKAARLKSEDMAVNNYFAHKSPTYGDSRQMLKNMGIEFSYAAENIAINGSVSKVHSSFMSSSTHKANILGSGWTHVGLGISKRKNGTGIIVTEIFIKK